MQSDTPLEKQIPIELRLLAACCDRPENPEQQEHLQELLNSGTDWTAFTSTALRHHVEGFVFDRLKDCDDVPPNIRESWRTAEHERVRRSLMQVHSTKQLHTLLNGQDVPNIVLKGIPLSQEVYGSLALRRSGDIDLLVDPHNAWTAVQLLAENGFLPVGDETRITARQMRSVVRHFKEITLRNSSNVLVDLHWKLVDTPGAFRNFDAIARSRRIVLDQTGEIAVLPEAEQFAYLCMHGALSDWSRLKWLADINAIIGDRDDAQIVSWHDRAKELGCGPAVLQALGLREILWGKAPPEKLATKIAEISKNDFLAFPIDRMLTPYKTASSRDAIARVRRQTRVRSILYGSHSKAVLASSAHMRVLPDVLALPLPRFLDWLYFPLRPFFWLVRKFRA